MTVPTTTPNATTPPTLTPAQARALLHALLSTAPNSAARPTSTTPNAPRPRTTNTTSPTKPAKVTKSASTPQQHNITVDASTRIMGHCNSVSLSPVSATEQASRIEEMVRGALAATASPEKRTNVNLTINAGINLMGSKNVVVVGDRAKGVVGAKDASTVHETRTNDALAAMMKINSEAHMVGRKRRAQSEPADTDAAVGKKVKVEA